MKKRFVMLSLALVLAGCSKEEPKKDPAPATQKEPAPEAKKDPTPEPAKEPAPDADADYVKVLASHAKPKQTDPVIIQIPSFKVVTASFDPAKLEGGTADLELDLLSLVSDSPRRDGDIKSPDYVDVEKFGVAAIHLDNVKKTAENEYSADATVKANGVEKKLPVEFDVLETTADGIRIKATHTFRRLDFSIGAPEGEDSVATDLTIEMQLTLKKTA